MANIVHSLLDEGSHTSHPTPLYMFIIVILSRVRPRETINLTFSGENSSTLFNPQVLLLGNSWQFKEGMSWNASIKRGRLCWVEATVYMRRGDPLASVWPLWLNRPCRLCYVTMHVFLWLECQCIPDCGFQYPGIDVYTACQVLCAKWTEMAFLWNRFAAKSQMATVAIWVINLINNLSNNTYLIVWLIMNVSSQWLKSEGLWCFVWVYLIVASFFMVVRPVWFVSNIYNSLCLKIYFI